MAQSQIGTGAGGSSTNMRHKRLGIQPLPKQKDLLSVAQETKIKEMPVNNDLPI